MAAIWVISAASRWCPNSAPQPLRWIPGNFRGNQTQFGWHIILVEDRRTEPPAEFESMREQLKSELSIELLSAHLAALSEQAVIERFNADGTPLPAAEGAR